MERTEKVKDNSKNINKEICEELSERLRGKKKRKHKKLPVVLSIIGVLIVVFLVFAGIYLNDYYHAIPYNVSEFIADGAYAVEEIEEGVLAFLPEGYREGDEQAGIVFYPGGKVEYMAYKALMEALASRGVACILIEMPFNLAMFDMDAADGMTAKYPEVDEWYMAGHSLGGSMAASYVEDNDDFAGLILLASYSIDDLSDEGLRVLSICASEDRVLNAEAYEKNKKNLPDNYVEYVIEGGCHAYFGVYGAQEGDGTPTITNVEQIKRTAEAIVKFVE